MSRTFEEREAALNWRSHPGIGSEGTQVGAFFGEKIRSDDVICPHYRGIVGALFARGVSAKQLVELGGPWSGLMWPGIMGPSPYGYIWPRVCGVLATELSQLAGAALVFKIKKLDRVAIVSMGDGSTNLGAFHEALNFASLNDLPLVIIVVNNFVFMHTPLPEHMRATNITDRARAYGIPGIAVNGNDAIAVHNTVDEAIKRARRGEGPTLIECKTYRWMGHWAADPVDEALYMPKWIIEEWKVDPIEKLREQIIDRKILTEEKIKEIDQEVRDEVVEAFKLVEKLPRAGKMDALKVKEFEYA